MRRAAILGAVLCAVALACVDARATTAIQLTPEEQVAQSRAICLGRCTKIETRNVDGRIYTYVTLEVREVLKGDVIPGRLVIKQIGGEVGDFGEWIYGSPRFDVDRESLVFLSTNDDGAYVVDGLFMGNYFVERGVDGSEWLRRDTGGEGSRILKSGGDSAEDPMAYLSIDALRALARRSAAKARTDFAVEAQQVPREYDQPFEGESSVVPSFVLMNNARWFEPDSNQAVPFYANTDNFDQGSQTPDLVAAVQDSLNAWSTIDGCSFRYQYSGIDNGGCGWGGRSITSRECLSTVMERLPARAAGRSSRSAVATGRATNRSS